jgi:hypothetical protein
MKKLAVLILLASLVAVPAYAQLGDTDTSSFTIQNLGASAATVTVTFYNEAGNQFTPNPIQPGLANPFTLGIGQQKEIVMANVPAGGLADGRYSVVVESTEPIGVIANLKGQSGTIFYNGSYSGFDMGATTIYFPAVHHKYYVGWNSLISIQNTTASPITVTIDIYNDAGAKVATKVYNNVAGFSSVHLDLETEGTGLGVPALLDGSAKVVCTGACVGTDNQTGNLGRTQSYSAFLSGGNTLYAPALYNNYYSWNGSFKVQNIGTVPTNVTVTYYVEGGASCTAPVVTNLQPSQAFMHYLPDDWSAWPGCAGISTLNKTIAAKAVSSSQDIVGVVNASNAKRQAQTYNAFTAADGATTVGLPAIYNNYYNWYTSFTCQNVGSGTANVSYSYAGLGCPGGSGACNFSLGAGAAKEIVQRDDLGATLGPYAVTVTASGSPVACIANQSNYFRMNQGEGDWSMSYNGFGQ